MARTIGLTFPLETEAEETAGENKTTLETEAEETAGENKTTLETEAEEPRKREKKAGK